MARRKNARKTAQNSKNAPETCVSEARGNQRSLKQSSQKTGMKGMLQSNDTVPSEPKPPHNLLKNSEPLTTVYKLQKSPRTGKQQVDDRTACRPSKQGLVVEMLARPDGASLNELISATGWLPHSTRAVLSRLRRGGYQIDRRHQEGNSRYHLMLNPIGLSA